MKKQQMKNKVCKEEYPHGRWTLRELNGLLGGTVYVHLKTGMGNHLDGFDEAVDAMVKVFNTYDGMKLPGELDGDF